MNFTDFRKNTSFGKFLYSFLLNRLGDSVDVLTMSWLIYLLSGSAAVSALAMGINYIPSIVIQPLAGAWVERMHKKKVQMCIRDSTNGDVIITPGQRLSVLEQDHFKYDDFTVLDTVIMGNARLYEIMKEKDAIYAKEDFSDEDGIRASELEGEFALSLIHI